MVTPDSYITSDLPCPSRKIKQNSHPPPYQAIHRTNYPDEESAKIILALTQVWFFSLRDFTIISSFEGKKLNGTGKTLPKQTESKGFRHKHWGRRGDRGVHEGVTHSQGQSPISCMFSHVVEDARNGSREHITQRSSETHCLSSSPAASKGLIPGFELRQLGLKKKNYKINSVFQINSLLKHLSC